MAFFEAYSLFCSLWPFFIFRCFCYCNHAADGVAAAGASAVGAYAAAAATVTAADGVAAAAAAEAALQYLQGAGIRTQDYATEERHSPPIESNYCDIVRYTQARPDLIHILKLY